MSDNAVGAIAVFCIFGLPIVAIMLHRVLKHQERIAMIQQGYPVDADPRDTYRAMKMAAKMGVPPSAVGESAYLFYANARLHRGITTTFIGVAIVVGLSFIGYHHGTISPGPWLIGGLVPLFIGLAQVTGAVLSGAQIGNFGVGRGYTMPPPGPIPPSGMPPNAAPPRQSGSPWGWRPGATPGLDEPPKPPNRR
ncbi:MAG: hypothetical protein HKL92_05695 [Candidatus Eremiobacteraeota bacterium]|nr:hypothetical protein [Candidatus Eremiobacteraeota bacterium]NNM92818.1 hypothetical protein [Candidatus Eremiobacteraeota bacterium]